MRFAAEIKGQDSRANASQPTVVSLQRRGCGFTTRTPWSELTQYIGIRGLYAQMSRSLQLCSVACRYCLHIICTRKCAMCVCVGRACAGVCFWKSTCILTFWLLLFPFITLIIVLKVAPVLLRPFAFSLNRCLFLNTVTYNSCSVQFFAGSALQEFFN